MSLDFPTRFLKKLDIYQQIRSDQGISKHKYLWKYEAAFLQTSYGKGHQHLSDFVSRSNFKKWIEETTPFNPRRDEDKLNYIIANLFWRGYIDVVERVNDKRVKKAKGNIPEGLKLFDRNSIALKSGKFGDESNLDYRSTLDGLLIGEVLSEINNKNKLLAFLNQYKYSWILDTIWLIVFWGIIQLFLADELKGIHNIIIQFYCLQLNYTIIIGFVLLFGWPGIALLYRKLYSSLER